MALPHLTPGESDEYYSANDLLHQAVNGSDQALCELFERHGPSIRRRFTRKIPERWQSVLTLDDLMQETYTNALSTSRTSTRAGRALLRVGWRRSPDTTCSTRLRCSKPTNAEASDGACSSWTVIRSIPSTINWAAPGTHPADWRPKWRRVRRSKAPWHNFKKIIAKSCSCMISKVDLQRTYPA